MCARVRAHVYVGVPMNVKDESTARTSCESFIYVTSAHRIITCCVILHTDAVCTEQTHYFLDTCQLISQTRAMNPYACFIVIPCAQSKHVVRVGQNR